MQYAYHVSERMQLLHYAVALGDKPLEPEALTVAKKLWPSVRMVHQTMVVPIEPGSCVVMKKSVTEAFRQALRFQALPVFASARSRKLRRSWPQKGSPSYTYQGAPKTRFAMASWVYCSNSSLPLSRLA